MNLGRLHYQSALNQQAKWIDDSKDRSGVEIFYFESEPVITLGVRATRERDVLQNSNVEILPVDRGGEATYHGPGQLVIFPAVHLPEWNLSVREWVALLLDTTVQLLKENDIPSEWSESKPGVFTPNGKIASVGLKVRGGWSRHGLALNVRGDLEAFSLIRACGVAKASIDQMSRWPNATTDLATIGSQWEKIFREQLHFLRFSRKT